MPAVAVVSGGGENINSVLFALERLNVKPVLTTEAAAIVAADRVILMGVGAAGPGMEKLSRLGLVDCFRRLEQPLLGICVGMQLLADRSDESPEVRGLGWMGGAVRALAGSASVRVPHVGWNTVTFDVDACGFRAGDEADFYFDHSFAYGDPVQGRRVAYCDHGTRFSAVVERDNIVAAQFHPEKSQTVGLRLLKGFLEQ